jgi:predicted HAD superfamily Cof-like phosphohydrolase
MLEYVGEFHEAFEIPEPAGPTITHLTPQVLIALSIAAATIRSASQFLHLKCEANNGATPLMRGHLMAEELAEFLEAMAAGDLVAALHELVDCEVVHKGSVRSLGLTDIYPDAQLAIHNANMSKLGPDGKPLKNAAGRVVKGPNFKKADLSPLFGPDVTVRLEETEVEQ